MTQTLKQDLAKKKALIWPLLLSLLTIIFLSTSCQPVDTSPVPCEGGGGKYACQGLDGHDITLEGVPEGVIPNLLYVSPERKQQLLDAPTDGTACVFMIAGDLDFYRNGELVTEFESPVTITYTIEGQDLEAYAKCQAQLVENKIVESKDQVSYFPIYFDNSVWKPFNPDNVSVDTESGVMTVKFTSWGDRPIGGGTQP